MTREETAKILSSLRAAFPNGYRNMDKADYLAIIEVWLDQFKSDSYEDVSRAVRSLIATSTSEWPPVIGAIKEEMSKQLSPRMHEDEAWRLVKKASGNGSHGAEKEFKKLPPLVQKVIGTPSRLRELAMYSDKEMDIESRSFKKTYREMSDEEIREEKLPEDVKMFASGVADKLRLPNG